MSLHVPFRFDYVGSFLRNEKLLKARSDFDKEIITKEELKSVEDESIKELIDKQKELGYHVITDGEFRRKSWHLDFFWGLNGIKGLNLTMDTTSMARKLTIHLYKLKEKSQEKIIHS